MAKTLPIAISDEITGTVRITVHVGREMRAQLERHRLYDPEVLENLIADKEDELSRQVADFLGCAYLLDE